MPVVHGDVEEARRRLEEAGAILSAGRTDHERWRAELGEATAVAYDDKVVVQGRHPSTIEGLLRGDGGRVHLYVDGASRGNPGPAAIGWVLVSGDGIVTEGAERIGRATNNQAEYAALLRGLETALNHGFDAVEVRSDSQLVVRQVTGAWDTKDPTLRERRVDARELLSSFEEWSITHVPRELNERANDLAQGALDG